MQHPLLEQAPELYDDIEFPDYCFTNSSDDPEGIQEPRRSQQNFF